MHHLRHTAEHPRVGQPKEAHSDPDPPTIAPLPFQQRRHHLPLPLPTQALHLPARGLLHLQEIHAKRDPAFHVHWAAEGLRAQQQQAGHRLGVQHHVPLRILITF